jgi:hypothetical protein
VSKLVKQLHENRKGFDESALKEDEPSTPAMPR